MSRIYNFSPGPAMLPDAVMQQAHQELLDWRGTGMSIMEMSHRSSVFEQIAAESEQDLRDIMGVPDDYSILFLQGGAQGQFSAIPLNLLGEQRKAAYVDSGIWSNKAIKEARKYADVQVAADSSDSNYTHLIDTKNWRVDQDAAYLYYCDNETINGVEFPDVPDHFGLPLVCDLSSNILSRPIDVKRFGLLYACSQKNIGPAGLTVVIIRNDLLERQAHPLTPSILDYSQQVKSGSMLNTPPTFAWYMAGLTFKWIKAQGGLETIGASAEPKSKKLYDFIDQSDFYSNPVDPACRSRMSVPFILKDEALNAAFLKASLEAGLANLKGHRMVGGMRASLYNSMPEAGVDALIHFMADFEKRHAG